MLLDSIDTTTLEKTVDMSAWGVRGPWDTEPDKAEWVDEATGLNCRVLRNGAGALCGYVGIPEGHKYYNVDYSDIPWEGRDVHGGLTYSNLEDGLWWLGFDCAHSNDYVPGATQYFGTSMKERYRDINYVIKEVQKLASSL